MENYDGVQDACGCRPMHLPRLPIPPKGSNPSPANEFSDEPKYFQEIGAEMIGNQLIIRVEKDKNRSSKRKAGQWEPPCDCAIPEIRMASATKGPRIVNAGDNNQILFRIRSRTLVGKDDANYKPEAFAYQLGAAKKGKDSNNQYRTITVHPQLNDQSQSQEVHSDHISDGNQNIYLLRIKKNGEKPGQRKRNIELEMRTPKPSPVARSPSVSLCQPVVPKPPEPKNEIKVETVKSPKKPDKKKKKKK